MTNKPLFQFGSYSHDINVLSGSNHWLWRGVCGIIRYKDGISGFTLHHVRIWFKCHLKDADSLSNIRVMSVTFHSEICHTSGGGSGTFQPNICWGFKLGCWIICNIESNSNKLLKMSWVRSTITRQVTCRFSGFYHPNVILSLCKPKWLYLVINAKLSLCISNQYE